MIRRPPRSTLFPTRRSSDLPAVLHVAARHVAREGVACIVAHEAREVAAVPRSEEHTSELQSRLHLVCRLLLEKKKKTEHGNDAIHEQHEDNRIIEMGRPCES